MQPAKLSDRVDLFVAHDTDPILLLDRNHAESVKVSRRGRGILSVTHGYLLCPLLVHEVLANLVTSVKLCPPRDNGGNDLPPNWPTDPDSVTKYCSK